MAEVPVTMRVVVYPDAKSGRGERGAHDQPFKATIVGYAWVSGLHPGGGPVIPPGQQPPSGGHPEHPIVPPGGYPRPEHPIVLPPDSGPTPPDPPTDPSLPKPPPPEGGWGWHPDYGWGYFPGQGGKPKPPGA